MKYEALVLDMTSQLFLTMYECSVNLLFNQTSDSNL